jgi:hypothetical protein
MIDIGRIEQLSRDFEAGKVAEVGEVALRILRQIASGQIPVEVASPLPPSVTITAAQLREALEFVNPDGPEDADQMESEVTIFQRRTDDTSTEGEPLPRGMYCYLSEYPEEGCIPLFDVSARIAEVAAIEKSNRDLVATLYHEE